MSYKSVDIRFAISITQRWCGHWPFTSVIINDDSSLGNLITCGIKKPNKPVMYHRTLPMDSVEGRFSPL